VKLYRRGSFNKRKKFRWEGGRKKKGPTFVKTRGGKEGGVSPSRTC